MKPASCKRHASRATRGETLVETMAATLVGLIAIVMLFTAATTAAKMNHDAGLRTADLQQQQQAAALQNDQGTRGAVTLEHDGTTATIPARFYGGESFGSYRLQINGGSSLTGPASDSAFYNTRPVSQAERAAFEAWPHAQGLLCWYRVSEPGHEYFVARSVQQPDAMCLVYYGGIYYKCTAVSNGADVVASASGFDVAQLDGAETGGRRWVAVSVS